MFNYVRKLAVIALLAMFFTPSAWALVLPDPIYPYAIQYDDFYSYSGAVLKNLYDRGYLEDNYYVSTGTGTLDLVLYSGPSVNNDSPFDPSISENKISTANTNKGGYGTDIWQADVDDLLTWLDGQLPVFLYDLNQTGNNNGVYVSAYFWISYEDGTTYRDMNGDAIKSWWSLDIFNNGELDTFDSITGDFNENYAAFAPNTITYEYPAGNFTTLTGANVGGGHGDFIVYADTMDLTPFADSGLIFNFQPFFGNSTQPDGSAVGQLNNGPEEVYLSKRLTPPTIVPEPSTLLLLGAGFLGLGAFARLRKQ